MPERLKYLNIIVLLTFLVGQVQYAYAWYFCTMNRAPVSSTSNVMMMDNSNENSCAECGVQQVSAEQSLKSNCMQARLQEKSVVDSFTSSQKLVQHFAQSIMLGHVSESFGNQLFPFNHKPFTSTDPPPLDIPTSSGNLRI
ncbi:MAG TPA: hypothetical protein VLX91_01020 [Candidatus Acidoferrales bacterium]|nr:hypothetical protein [Candidatus Acidoferrales bacterium]